MKHSNNNTTWPELRNIVNFLGTESRALTSSKVFYACAICMAVVTVLAILRLRPNIWHIAWSVETSLVDTNRKLLCHKFSGRLGNELFQYASVLGLAFTLNRTAVFKGSIFLEPALRVSMKLVPPADSTGGALRQSQLSA